MTINIGVSVIITHFECFNFLVEAVDSVLTQSHENLEILIVDDSSSVETFNLIIDKYKNVPCVKYYTLSENSGGPARPRNFGVSKAAFEYICFLDCDDVWEKDKIKNQLNFMQLYNLDFCSTLTSLIDDKSKPIKKSFFNFKKLFNIIIKNDELLHIYIRQICLSSVMLKKKLNVKFDEQPWKISVEDYDLWLSLIYSGKKYMLLNENLVKYRVLQNSISERTDVYKQEVKSLTVVCEKLIHYKKFNYFPHFVLRSIFSYFVR